MEEDEYPTEEIVITKETLCESLKVLLGSVFAFSLKTQNYHWNVRGANFAQDHEFFGDMYETLYGHVDQYAEHVRMLGYNTPGSLIRFLELNKLVEEELSVPASTIMYARLFRDNENILNYMKSLRDVADQLKEIGLVNTLETNIAYHDKMRWMLRAFYSE